MLRVVYTTSARADLIEAWMFVAEENLDAADQMLETINKGINLLVRQPLIGRERPELRIGVRSWPTSTPYILYYAPDSESLTLLRVLHHARDLQDLDLWD